MTNIAIDTVAVQGEIDQLIEEITTVVTNLCQGKTKITNKEQSKIRFAGCDVLISKSSLVKNISSLIRELIK